MKKAKCLRCNTEIIITIDTLKNKLIGLVGTKDAWMCDKCLAVEAEHIDFADDRGTVSDAMTIPG